MNNMLYALIAAKLAGGGGGGGDVTAQAVLAAISDMTEEQAAAALAALGGASQDDISTVFRFLGDKPTIADLPATGNTVGDIWFVEAEHGNFVWLVDEENPDGFWDEFGQPIDLSAYQLKPTVNTVAGASASITPAKNNIYNCGTLTSLTISNPPATGSYSIVFTSGATPTTTSIPATILGLEDFSAEANTIYEINVLDNRAVVGSWAVSA